MWKIALFLKMKRGLNELSFVIDFVDFSFVNDKVFKDLALKNIVKWN